MENIKIEREKKHLTQSQLGKLVGLSGAQISRFESGQREPSITTLVKLAEIFGVTVGYLVGVEKKTPVPAEKRDEGEVFDLSKKLTPAEAKKFHDLLEWYITING